MSDAVSEQGRFGAREFIARWSRETGETLSPGVIDRVTFAYEMGYLRGRSDAMQAAMTMFDQTSRPGETSRKEDDADPTSAPDADAE